MGRVKSEIVSVICLALLAVSVPLRAQEAAQEKKPAPAPITTKAAKTWEKLANGVWEAKVPRFPYDKKEEYKPEFAVIRLSPERYEEFKKDRKEFVNKHKIFGKVEVKKQDLFYEATPKQEDPEDSYWYLVVVHWPSSTAAISSYPGWTEPK
jgi:hypothetical protein